MDFLRKHSGIVTLLLLLMLFILVPFGIFEETINRTIETVLREGRSSEAIGSILGALLVLDIVLPIPSSLVSTSAGLFLGFGKGAFASWAGMSLGCFIGYGLGRSVAGRPIQRLVKEKEHAAVSNLFAQHGIWTIALCRAVPVLAEASVLLAGMFRMPFRQFVLLTLLSNLGPSLIYAGVGAFALKLHSFLFAFAGAMLLPLLFILASRFWTRK